MKRPLKVILTGVGCPGGMTMINTLKSVTERKIYIIGTDTKKNAAGRFFIDEFYEVPYGHDPNYIRRIMEIYLKTGADFILPQTSYEVLPLSQHKEDLKAKGINVLVSNYKSVLHGGDKWLTYKAVKNTRVKIPEPILVTSIEEFEQGLKNLGYPQRKVCFKPPYSKGSRGFRVITEETNRLDQLINQKAGSFDIGIYEVREILAKANPFPELILMNYISGKEYTADLYCKNGEVLCGFVKTRESIRDGLAMYFELVDRPDIWEYASIVAKKLNLSHFINVQFKNDVLLEVNPRVSTFILQKDFNMPYLGIQHYLNEISDDELKSFGKRVRHTRRTVRFFDQVFYDIGELDNSANLRKGRELL